MTRPVLSLSAALVFLAACHAQGLRPVPATQVDAVVKSAPMNKLPAGATHPVVDRKQLVTDGTLTLIPVRYQFAETNGNKSILPGGSLTSKSVCGVFVQSGGSSSFLPTLGVDNTEAETCNALLSVGALHTGTPHGDLILIYSASSPNASPREPIILSWSDGTYRVNDDLSQKASTGVQGAVTIASVRRALGATARP